MPVLKALGLGVVIIVLKVLTPQIFSELQGTAIAFLHGAHVSADMATDLAASAGTSIEFSNAPPRLPQAPQIVGY
ncbi:MAG: hypothetical protein JWN64_389 [Parcubacteria group bacterium]|nr:hypothetical protein [Parcubacteria group bacterium]